MRVNYIAFSKTWIAKAVCLSLIALQAKYTKSYDKARQAKAQQTLVIGEEVLFPFR